MTTREIVDRRRNLFETDIDANRDILHRRIEKSRVLVIGGAGSIGQALVKEVFSRSPTVLHVVDLSENGLVELVRDIRSSRGYMNGDFRTFALDFGAPEFRAMVHANGPYDMVANLAALKHVRSERDPFSLMRLTRVNVLNTIESVRMARAMNVWKYFAVSSDKAANPFNMMGASKRIMEMFLARVGDDLPVSTARFANVAFSNGSLLDGFRYRLQKRQPLAAPSDVRRYFVTDDEAGRLCLLSLVLGNDRDIFFPLAPEELHLITFVEIAERFLRSHGYEPKHCESEEEARSFFQSGGIARQWPLYTFPSDTTGEKPFEEFFTDHEDVDRSRFAEVGVVRNEFEIDPIVLDRFTARISTLLDGSSWTKADLVEAYSWLLPHFSHIETGRSLDGKM